jgi:dihydropteroate synthase
LIANVNVRTNAEPIAAPAVMGILNVTPDSFSDGGDFFSSSLALARARTMVVEGVDWIDVGGESTRPGAAPVPLQQEMDRVLPVIEAIADELPVAISIDTSKPALMTAAVAVGAGLINDVNALRAPGAVEAAAASGARVCLMHRLGEPGTMQQAPHYDDVVAEVKAFLVARLDVCEQAGIPRERLWLDPGFGFGKTVEHNLCLLRGIGDISALGLPVLAGLSRKSLIDKLLGLPIERRLHPSVALATLAAWLGADILRVHDVEATVQAMAMVGALRALG